MDAGRSMTGRGNWGTHETVVHLSVLLVFVWAFWDKKEAEMLNGKPLCIEIYAGLGGWSEGFIAEGWTCIGFDIERHVYGGAKYPGQLVLMDALTIHGSMFKNADCLVMSPPCQSYSWLAMPWSRSKDPNNSKAAKALRAKWEAEGPDNRLFDACFRIQREAIYARRLDLRCCELDYSKPGCKRCHIPLIVENVRGAQPWVGRAPWNYGSFFLWGDVPALMPKALKAQKSAAGHCKSAVATERPGGRMIAGDVKNADGTWTSTVETGTKFSAGTGGWFGDYKSREGRGLSQISGNSSRSTARKAASAMIAKIPLTLSTHIARVYKP